MSAAVQGRPFKSLGSIHASALHGALIVNELQLYVHPATLYLHFELAGEIDGRGGRPLRVVLGSEGGLPLHKRLSDRAYTPVNEFAAHTQKGHRAHTPSA